jgi:hypothetical protein
MAGPEENRPDYLKNLVARNVLSGTKDSIADTFKKGYQNSPAVNFDRFYKWSKRPGNYDQVGIPDAKINNNSAINPEVVQTALGTTLGSNIWAQRALLSSADYGLWVEQWFLANHPDLINTAWDADINNEGNLITVVFEDTSVHTFVPTNFDKSKQFLYVWYNSTTGEVVGPLNTGATITLGTSPFPSTVGWELESDIPKTSPAGFERIYKRTTITSSDPVTGIEYDIERMYHFEITSPLNRSYRIDKQSFTGAITNQVQIYIYQLGSGNLTLDAVASETPGFGEFFPFLPVRINNTFVSESYLPTAYAQIKKAYKKATGAKLSEFIEKLEDNPQLGDIDYVYVTFGVSLNVLENSCKRYVYKFFQKLALSQIGGPSTYNLWKSAVDAEAVISATWVAWKNAQTNEFDPLFYTPEPPRAVIPELPTNVIVITDGATSTDTGFDMRISWKFITNGSGTGLAKPGAKSGELWFDLQPSDSISLHVYGGDDGRITTSDASTQERVRLYWQKSPTSYVYLDIVGLIHENYVYGSKAVTITAFEALSDTDESGFIIPLHYDTWKETSLVHTSQMATACVFAVMNSYEIKKLKWYQTGIFAIILIIIGAILSVVFTGGVGTVGLLGSAMSVGSAFGLTGVTAAIVGSVTNALAALILSTVISRVAEQVFGPVIGAIVAAATMMVIGAGVSNYQSSGAFAVNWGDILKVDNLMKLTNSLGQAYGNQINIETANIGVKMEEYTKSAKAEAEKIQQAFIKEFGYGGGDIDPMMLISNASSNRIIAESSDTFLTRTLMTGSEIAELSLDLLYNFSEYSIKLSDAYT